MGELISALSKNVILMTVSAAWVTAQFLKLLTAIINNEEFHAERLIGAGGMPSSHTSLVVSLASAIGFHDGIDSSLFAIAVVLAGVVMYDAAGVRQAAGKQAMVINQLVRELRAEHKIRDSRLKELLGHTPREVLAGALLGFLIAYCFHLFY